MIRRRWAATCDRDGCDAVEILTAGDQYDGKWQLGERISDAGWQASPSEALTFCPNHKAEE